MSQDAKLKGQKKNERPGPNSAKRAHEQTSNPPRLAARNLAFRLERHLKVKTILKRKAVMNTGQAFMKLASTSIRHLDSELLVMRAL